MDTITRRRFLIRSGVTAGVALAAGAATIGIDDLIGAGQNDPLPGDASILVLVTLYGGNDGLNTVIPAGDPAYQKARPDLAYQDHEVLPLADGLGLNPAMTGFKKLWDAKKLAIIRGVSYPQPDRSHFRSMAIWQTATPASAVPTGWLGRWLDATDRNPLHGVAIGATLPPLLAGAQVAGAALPLTGIALPRMLMAPVAGLSAHDAADSPLAARSAHSFVDLRSVEQTFGPVLDAMPSAPPDPADPESSPADPAVPGPSPSTAPDHSPVAKTPRGELATQLDVVARCIAAGAPTRAYSVSLSSFDTHANEKGTQQTLLGELDRALTAFSAAIQRTPAGRRVVVAVYSEFGRRVVANANEGTDHGTAGPMFVLGDAVRGGFYGDQPSLTKLNDGDLYATTDFRDVYATLLNSVLDTDPGRVIPDYRPRPVAFL
jgi:uncharacterized protein (DUF1501 family)